VCGSATIQDGGRRNVLCISSRNTTINSVTVTISGTVTDSNSHLPIRFHRDMHSSVLETIKLPPAAMHQGNGPRRREFHYILGGHRRSVRPSAPLKVKVVPASMLHRPSAYATLYINPIHPSTYKSSAVSAQVIPLGKSRPTALDGKHVSVSTIPIIIIRVSRLSRAKHARNQSGEGADGLQPFAIQDDIKSSTRNRLMTSTLEFWILIKNSYNKTN